MITIGDFASRAHVTVKALRHYARLGLLKPVWIDRFTGYRYYSEEQLARLQRILALKGMGFSLRQVALLLDENLSVEALRKMLAQKREELTGQIHTEQERLACVEARLNELESGSPILFTPVIQPKEKPVMKPEKIVTLPPFRVIGMRYLGKNQNQEITQLWQDFFPRHTEVQPRLNPQVMFGVCDMAVDAEEGEFEYIAGIEVPPEAPVPPGMVAKDLPSIKFAVFVHQGSLAGLKDTYCQIYDTWLPENGLERAPGPDFEYYDWDFDPSGSPESKLYLYVPVK